MSADASPLTPVFEVDDVTKSFGAVAALRGATLRCLRGEVTALVGDNGAGKSTLVRCMTGVHRPDGGTMRFEGREVSFTSPEDVRELGIETVFQDLALVEDLTVWQNMYLNRELGRGRGPFRLLDRKAMAAGAKKTIERLLVNMPPVEAKVRKLSGGQRQSIAISRAVSWGSSLVIMDEPTAALGVRETAGVEELIVRLRGEGIAQLIISHDLDQVMRISDSIWVMRQGRTVAHLRTRETSNQEIVAAITGLEHGKPA